jgi:multiple sugar transport system permease protein
MIHAKQVSSKPKINFKEAFWGYLFIAPGLLGILVFFLFPVLSGLGISFTKWGILNQPVFIGLDNYIQMTHDKLLFQVLGNTFYYMGVSVPLNSILALLLALALNQKIKGLSIFRTAFYMPVVSATIAVSMVWMWLFDSNYGLINLGLTFIGLDPVQWLTNPHTAMPAIIIVSVWKSVGWNMIIFLAALQDVPVELIDAARVDGANKIQQFLGITLPLISPAIFFTTIMGVIGSFQGFDLVYAMTHGGPARATTVIGYYIWQVAFSHSKMGYGAAISYFLFFMILVVTLIQWFLRKRWVFGE